MYPSMSADLARAVYEERRRDLDTENKRTLSRELFAPGNGSSDRRRRRRRRS